MTADKLRKILPLILQILTILFGGFAVQQHYAAQQPGVYASVSAFGMPLSELLAGLTAAATFIGGGIASLKGGAGSGSKGHIGSLADELAQSGDKAGLELLTPLAVHLAGKKTP